MLLSGLGYLIFAIALLSWNFLLYFAQTIFTESNFYIKNKIKIENSKYFDFLYKITVKSFVNSMLKAFMLMAIYIALLLIAYYYIRIFNQPIVYKVELIYLWPVIFVIHFVVLITLFSIALHQIKQWRKANNSFETTYSEYFLNLSKDWENKIVLSMENLDENILLKRADGKVVKRIIPLRKYKKFIRKYNCFFTIEDFFDFYVIERWDKYLYKNKSIDFEQLLQLKQEFIDKYSKTHNENKKR
ncbi:Uncharacterised protein [Metamycoplasma cloacale]|uniref:Uncharacterized protein n=2 Tax=Metamycoplasma cloacale TaxID=92401 RepID=A0A2Z4LLF2_9BACT|nr:hypothetical protein DK849_00280 [Metamycoplasma cloacale]VEU79128.1 Uncharacterised protein [Metamycoplasma cloacale]